MHREIWWGNLLQNRQSQDREGIGKYNITMELTDSGFMNTNSMEQLHKVERHAFELTEPAGSNIKGLFLESR
jgi:hypothetical protein